MKKISFFLCVSLLIAGVISFGVSAAETPLETLLPDNVTGFGTTSPTSLLEDIIGTETDGTAVGTVPDTTVSQTAGQSGGGTETTTTNTTESKSDDLASNLALSGNGASYVIVKLSEDKTSEEEVKEFFGGTNDNGGRLNDGTFGEVESASLSVAVGGTGRTFRYKFDLGKEGTIKRIVFKNIQDSFSADPLNNRSFDESKFKVSVGGSPSDVKPVGFSLNRKKLGGSDFSFDVTLDLERETSGRYVYLEAGPENGAFVLSLDEIQIFGEAAEATKAPQNADPTSIARTPSTGDSHAALYLIFALISLAAMAAVYLYVGKKRA